MKIYVILLHKHSKFKKALIQHFAWSITLYKADLDYTKHRENQNRNFSIILFEKSVKNFINRKSKERWGSLENEYSEIDTLKSRWKSGSGIQ